MSIDMHVSASQSQATSTSNMTKQQIHGYERLQTAINDFTLSSPLLTGQAYDSAKAYFAQVLYPLSQGGILLSEAVEQAIKKFPEEYVANVDSGDLKESELEEKIRQADGLMRQAEEIGQQLRSSKTPDVMKGVQLSANARMIGLYGNIKQELEEKLRKLMDFNSHSPKIFAEIQALENAVNQGIAQTQTAFNSSTGTFTIPPKDALNWRQMIADKWEGYVERHTIENNMEIKQVPLPSGEIVYMVYKNGELDRKATSDLATELAKDDLTSIKSFFAGAGYQVLENNGVKALLEAVFGEREVNDSLKQHKGYNEGVFVGNLFSLVQSGAEFIGGTLWFLGGTGSSLALAPATGMASTGAIPIVSASSLAIWSHAAAVGGMSIQNIIGGGNYDNSSKAVENMNELFESKFGSELKKNISKNGKRVDGQQVYKVDNKKLKELDLKKGDQLYLDGLHKDHLEVFDSKGNFSKVLNLDGTINRDKTLKGLGRVLK